MELAAPRLPVLLASDMVVFKVDSGLEEFWYKDLKPFKHYIPVLSDFSDLIARIIQVRQMPLSEQKQIVRNANKYARERLSEDSLDCYTWLLLKSLAAQGS